MLTKNQINGDQIKKKMYESKIDNQVDFWNENIKRKICFSFYKSGVFRQLFQSFIKYEISEIIEDTNYFSDDRIAIYTVIFGEYDNIIEPECYPDNCDYYIITDNVLPKDSNWKKINIDLGAYDLIYKTNIDRNRFFKMHPHKIFPNYKYSIYLDGNIKILTDFTEFIQNMNKYGLKMHKHYRQNCAYKELEKCLKLKKDQNTSLSKHKNHLKISGMPKEYGLLEVPVIVREHHNPTCIKVMEEWWREFSMYSKRDQISLAYVLWKNNIKIDEIALLGNDIYSNYAFKKEKHI